MLNHLFIKNFKSIVSAELNFGRVNLFIGPNGGGKTNILEAIGILSAALGRSVKPEDLEHRGVRLSLPRLFKATFKNRHIPLQFNIRAVAQFTEYSFTLNAGDDAPSLYFKHEELKENNLRIFGRSPGGFRIHKKSNGISGKSPQPIISNTRGGFDSARALIDISSEAVDELEQISRYCIYAPQTALLRGIATESRPVEPLGLTGGRLAPAVQEVLRFYKSKREELKIYYDIIWGSNWSDMVRVSRPQSDIVPPQVPTLPLVTYFKDKYMRQSRSWLSANDASEGTLYLLFVATILAHPEAPRIFALDNVDGTLNPALVKKLVSQITKIVRKDKNRQVFLTSHNPTALDALDLFDNDHRVFVVRREKKTGHTIITNLRPEAGMTKKEWIGKMKGRNTSALWLENFIPGAL